MLQPGQLINAKYRIVRLIGDGGMGSVYEARHEVLGHRVALKFLHPEIASQPALSQRFLQEARLSAAIDNPHIVRVTDVDTSADGGAFLVMELLQGESLQSLISRERRLDPERAVAFTLQILQGLEAAHALGVVHRDLKPDNVFVVPGRQGPLLKVLDFGIAKLRASEEYQMTLTRPGSIMGTPEYMAPEQAYSADLVDQRSDIYSLGVMLFEMLSGLLPAEGETPQQIAELVLKGHSRRLAQLVPSLPTALIDVVETSMRPDPNRRFANVPEMRAALTRALEGSHHVEMRASSVPKTLPPQPGPPPVTLEQPARVKTDSMPATVAFSPQLGSQGSATQIPLGAAPSSHIGPSPLPTVRKRSRGRGWMLFWIVMLGLTIGGGVLAVSYFGLDDLPEPPPEPTRRQIPGISAVTSVLGLTEDDDDAVRADEVNRVSSPHKETDVSPARPPTLPTFQMPTSFPSTFPLPVGLPTTLPTSIPGLPALPFPLPGIPTKQAQAPVPSGSGAK
ncbi:MAG TPA: serine/threonine-protein kinase [Polyangiaceae bacterium]|nr:serine/threonine-protein kinase [Polyangiaceae bacterium]